MSRRGFFASVIGLMGAGFFPKREAPSRGIPRRHFKKLLAVDPPGMPDSLGFQPTEMMAATPNEIRAIRGLKPFKFVG